MSSDDFSPLEDLDLGATVRGLRAGQKLLNRYTLKRILGRGGMGVVWLAYDESLEREIAFKFLPETVTHDRSAVDEIKRETKQSLELTHPHIVRIYDFVHDEHCAGLSMEYIEGDTLSNLRADQPNKCFDVTDLELWIRQLCSALESAHEDAELAHRDLKPANLMIDKRGRLKIADFGISRSLSNTVARMTMHHGASGTLVYMSPQQALGEPPSILDDIYSLGATLYELLTSKPPFYQGEILAQVREKVPPSMTQRRKDLRIYGKPIPRRWEDTVAACLSKDPARRPQSCREVMQMLGVSDTRRLPRPRTKSSDDRKPRPARKLKSPRTETPGEPSTPSAPPAYDYDLVAETPKPKAKTHPPKSEPEQAPAPTPAPPRQETPAPLPAAPLPPEPLPPPTAPPQRGKAILFRPWMLTVIFCSFLLTIGVSCFDYWLKKRGTGPRESFSVAKLEEKQRQYEKAQAEKGKLLAVKETNQVLSATLATTTQTVTNLTTTLARVKDETNIKIKALEQELADATAKAKKEGTLAAQAAQKIAEAKLQKVIEASKTTVANLEAEVKKEKAAAAAAVAEIKVEQEKAKAAAAAAAAEIKRLQEKTKEAEIKTKEAERIKNLRGSVTVKPVPENAHVTMPGQIGRVQADKAVLFAGLLTNNYEVQVQLDGYETTNILTEVTDITANTTNRSTNASSKPYSVQLTRSTGALKLASRPTGANYTLTMIGPKELIKPGTVPLSGQTRDGLELPPLPTGTYNLKLEKGPWVMTNQEVKVNRKETSKVELDLPFGRVSLQSDPPGATVFYQGEARGKTPLELPEIALGSAEFVLKKDAYRPVTNNLMVRPQQTASSGVVTLELRYGPRRGQKWTNSLGMRFVPIGDGNQLMCIWETRKRDFDKFLSAKPLPGGKRSEPEFIPKQTSGHPVVNVSWDDAKLFCGWLTEKEQDTTESSVTRLEKQFYRLPTDAEWSEAAGLKNETGATPADRHGARRGEYPWGKTFPPPVGAGNYDKEFLCDRYDFTAIVGSFKANHTGLFDIAGNVWEWCDDWFDGQKIERVARGGSWRSTWRDASADVLLSSYRLHLPPGTREPDVGFRCVLEIGKAE